MGLLRSHPSRLRTRKRRFYLKVINKFWISHLVALLWMAISIYLARPWLNDLADIISLPFALAVIAGISYIPGYMNAFLVASLIMDRQPAFMDEHPKTDSIRAIDGWPDAIGEDIVLTWKLLEKRWRIYFEPLAVAFTEVPSTLVHFVRQRSRWARGMIEGLKQVKPWEQPQIYTKYLTGINLILPYLDFVYTFCWIPGLLLAFFGYFWVVGPMTLFVLPLTLISYSILYLYQSKYVFKPLNLKVRKNVSGFVLFILAYQMIMSPVSVYGYVQELFKLRRRWK